ncbi:hypothetical protein [uncultured Gilvimarinus sp.]|uniref:NMCC_0638 family (lipo)protein n=1 Tax=uncultured Gilvimarinus sp. TaxID=1689143 RepID=UPI0030ED72AA|tara:strand:- start:5864 stop:6397 length:534 start_codon:yes stop_codon:yes gene_type:complete
MKILAIATFLLSPVLVLAATPDEEGQALRTSIPVQIYMGTCVVGRANPGAVGSQALEMGFSIASNEQATRYLSGNEGQAWYMNSPQGEFGITVLNNSLCSVFIHQGDPHELQASMEAWLPPQNSGFSYTKEMTSQSASLSTYMYKIFRDNQLMEQWTITTNAQPNTGMSAIMSYDGP